MTTITASFIKLHPLTQLRNPVMFVAYIASIFTTVLAFTQSAAFIGHIAVWLWLTVLFANYAEAVAEGRGKAQAAALRATRRDIHAKKLAAPRREASWQSVAATQLRNGDFFLIEVGDLIPADGEVVAGVASVDESAITGESAPVLREAGGDFSSVTGGTRVLSDWLVVRVTQEQGKSFLDRMIAMVEGARRGRTPNEIALSILLAMLTLLFLLVTATLLPFSEFAVTSSKAGTLISIEVLVALLICLIPTTIGGLLSAIGIAGMDRMIQANVVATSGRAIEAAGDVNVLLLDKTGTVTLGDRQASAFYPAPGVTELELAGVAQLASLADETPEGRSIVILAKQRFQLRVQGRGFSNEAPVFHKFSAQTRMSGADLPGQQLRKGAADAIKNWVESAGGSWPPAVSRIVEDVAKQGATPLVVSINAQVLGVVELRDVVKGGIRERFAELRQMGIRTIMVTGDNRLTAAAIAAEAGVDDFLAQATPQTKLAEIRRYQSEGHLVAMCGDGTNDAPALAQADVAVAMNSGTQAAKEAGNMVDLDSNPTKLIEVVRIGKQMLITRGALTTFSIANDVAKYFAIVPAAFASTYPALSVLNVMQLGSPQSAILAAVIFNALIIVFLVPLALRGVKPRALSSNALLRHNLLVYGLGGLIAPFIGIKLIDMLLNLINLA
jgi:potassium-transporting ATPase ATP-binding subunit